MEASFVHLHPGSNSVLASLTWEDWKNIGTGRRCSKDTIQGLEILGSGLCSLPISVCISVTQVWAPPSHLRIMPTKEEGESEQEQTPSASAVLTGRAEPDPPGSRRRWRKCLGPVPSPCGCPATGSSSSSEGSHISICSP